ncbi:hypothetical protein [Streptomyces regalis]|nr:hypothetical protein [Streptomyces regalis]
MTEKTEAGVTGSGYAGAGSRQPSGRRSTQLTGSERADRSNS